MENGEGLGPCVCAQQQPFFDVMKMSNFSFDGPFHDKHKFSQLELVSNAYMDVHGVLSLLVCAFGIPMNVLNVFVLTRPHMRTPVNSILTWLAVFDLFTMASYVPFALHFYIFTAGQDINSTRNSLGWMTFLIVHVDFTSTTHTISNWLGVTLAIFRYKHIFLPAKGHLTRIRRLVRARIAVFVVVVFSVVVMIPNFMMNKLMAIPIRDKEDHNLTQIGFVMEPLHLGTPLVKPLSQFNLWLHSVLAKLLPCILMVVYSGLLLQTLRTNVKMISRSSATLNFPVVSVTADDNGSYSHYKVETENNGNCEGLANNDGIIHQLLEPCRDSRSGSTSTDVSTTCGNCKSSDEGSRQSSLSPGNQQMTLIKSRRSQDNARTTRMLLAVIILYVVSELPNAILIILSASLPGFFGHVYLPLGDMLDILALFNNGINFLLYCVMSRDFRKTLLSMFDMTRGCRQETNNFKRIKYNGSPLPAEQKLV